MSEEQDRKLDQEIARGHEARALLTNPVLTDSIALMKKEVVEKWAACPARDVKGREWLWQFYQVTLKFEEKLTEVLNTGKLALEGKRLSMLERGKQFLRNVGNG